MIGLIDTGGWQRIIELKTGNSIIYSSDLLKGVSKIISSNPYPGELKQESDAWITNVALELNSLYSPDFIMLQYSQPILAGRFTKQKIKPFIINTFRQVERFQKETDFEPLIVGTGDLIDVKRSIDIEHLIEFGFTHAHDNYAEVHTAKEADIEKLKGVEGIEKILSKEEILRSIGGSNEFKKRLSDFTVIAEEGISLKGVGARAKKKYRISGKNKFLPIYTGLEYPSDITDIYRIIKSSVQKRKVALILIGGAGLNNFPYEYKKCKNHIGDFIYNPSKLQYLAMTTGLHFNKLGIPFTYMYDKWEPKNDYPYTPSRKIMDHIDKTIGRNIGKKSVAVGNEG